ncbi:hypothetical protein [Janthinobacterium agaricidamnosum]|nr:hypothetical protein [Janthinobacterium agaricidamnosum]
MDWFPWSGAAPYAVLANVAPAASSKPPKRRRLIMVRLLAHAGLPPP